MTLHPTCYNQWVVISKSKKMVGCFLYLSSSFTDWFLYKTHLYLCKQLYEGHDLPDSTDDPLQVIELCQGNIGRWIVFMVWLETCPNALYCFQEIRRRYTIPSIVTLDGLLRLKETTQNQTT